MKSWQEIKKKKKKTRLRFSKDELIKVRKLCQQFGLVQKHVGYNSYKYQQCILWKTIKTNDKKLNEKLKRVE